MLETFTVETFSIGDVFKLFYGDDQYVELTLDHSSLSKFKNPISNRDPFLLVFSTPIEIYIEPGCYNMEQEKVGKFPMSITPTMPLNYEGKYNYYEAVFT